MIPSSLAFAGFTILVLVASRLAGRRLRWTVLLAASYAFYATWSPYLPLVLGAVTGVSYLASLVLERAPDSSCRCTVAMWSGISVAAGALLVLKYTGVLGSVFEAMAGWRAGNSARPVSNPFVHIGVSYWSLQVVGYVVDVSQGIVPAERHLGRYALYLAFFPKMLQGPIERPATFLPQVEDPPSMGATDVGAALSLILWGVFQKMVVADRLAPIVDAGFGDPARFPGVSAFLATYLFAAQIYFDFAGYTCLAIGVGRLLGIRLSPNFNAPYSATSISEFWRRWHISFSSWILDYVFRPVQLGLRRWRTYGTPVALMVTFGFSGLWHGATWGFVVWGLLHGTYLACSVLFAGVRVRVRKVLRLDGARPHRPLQVLLTFHLVCLAWVFFRASTAGEGTSMIVHAVTGLPASLAALAHGDAGRVLLFDQAPGRMIFALALVVGATFLPRLLPELRTVGGPPAGASVPSRPWARAVAYSAVFYLVAFSGASSQSFIYARF
jgi:D-alanyl-lipoteichoic acid acyltransferase DltB (MBOAT superfamily)